MAFACGVFALAGGALSLAAWVFDLPRLADWNSAGLSTQPNTAVSILFAAGALLALVHGRGRLCAWLAAVPAVLGAATLFEHASGIDLGIDRLLTFDREWGYGRTTTPGRPGVPGSSLMVMIGVALIARTRGERAHAWSNALGLLVLPTTALSLVAYVLGASPLYDLPRYTAIAWQTSLLAFALAIGLLAAHWRRAPVSVLIEDGVTGEVVRRALPLIVMVPALMAWLRVEAQRAGLFGTAVGTTLLLVVLVALMCAGLMWTVTMLRRREAALAQLAAQLREADKRKDEFLATLAHELRNPLAPLVNGLELMKRDASLGAAPQSLVAMMQRQTALLRRMVDDLLDISRITRGHFELRRETIDLRDVLARAVETTRDFAGKHGHALTLALPDAPLRVFGDAERLAQVFGNLLHNACKYTPDGGRIEAVLARTDHEARVTVRDNGIGIPPHLRERVFEMFAQVDSSLERSHGGLGIGLTLVRRIVDKHGGVVSARAVDDGQGSEFIVALPLSRVAQDA